MRNRFEIKEENDEDGSRGCTIIENYIPKDIRMSMYSKKDDKHKEGHRHERHKTEPS